MNAIKHVSASLGNATTYLDVQKRNGYITDDQFNFMGGLSDFNFTWHFAGAIASTVVNASVKKGVITHEDAKNATLADMADIIQSQWFSNLMHTLAYAPNGLYARFGLDTVDFTGYSLDNQVDLYRSKHMVPAEWSIDRPLPEIDWFNVALTTLNTPTELPPVEALVVELSQPATKRLRDLMRAAGSYGCPVARKVTTISRDTLPADMQLALDGLVANHDIEPLQSPHTSSSNTRYRQVYPVIDHMLDILGELLRYIQDTYGLPEIQGNTSQHSRHMIFKPVDPHDGSRFIRELPFPDET
jgi:hypothetical protein